MSRTGRLLALLASVASLAVVAAFGAAPASATLITCGNLPHIYGVTFHALKEKGIGCEQAHNDAVYTFHHANYRENPWIFGHFHCTHTISNRTTSWHCAAPDGSKAFYTSWTAS